MADAAAQPQSFMRGVLAFLLISTVAVRAAPRPSARWTRKASALRASLLEDYDKLVSPFSTRRNNTSGGGTDVGLELYVFKTEAVSPAEGRIERAEGGIAVGAVGFLVHDAHETAAAAACQPEPPALA